MQYFPIPTTKRQLRRFVGLVNFTVGFLPLCPGTFAIEGHVDQCQKLQHHIAKTYHILAFDNVKSNLSRCGKIIVHSSQT